MSHYISRANLDSDGNPPLETHWYRPLDNGGYELIPSIPVREAPRNEWTMPMAGWLDYRDSGSDLSPQEWWFEQGKEILESASADEAQEDQLWLE